MAAEDPHKLADELAERADAMHRHSEQLGKEVAQAREDWERKRADPNVPGAPPPEEERDDQTAVEPSADETGDEAQRPSEG